jgi:hypothetical protein
MDGFNWIKIAVGIRNSKIAIGVGGFKSRPRSEVLGNHLLANLVTSERQMELAAKNDPFHQYRF